MRQSLLTAQRDGKRDVLRTTLEHTSMEPTQDILSLSTGLLTVLALAATSKIWIVSLPVMMALDAWDECHS